MFKTTNLTAGEIVDLSSEVTLVAPTDTPLTTLLMKNGVEGANSKIITWREKTLDTTADVAVEEGSETTVFQNSTRAELNNVMMIHKKATSVSGTVQAINVDGVGNEFMSEIQDRMTELKVNIEKDAINSTYDDGSTTGIRRQKGLIEWVPAGNIVSGGSNVTPLNFKDTVRKLWENGLGTNEFYAFVNAGMKEDIDAIFESKVYYTPQNSQYGFIVNKVITNFGTVNVILNRHMPVDKMLVFDPSYVKMAFLRKPFFSMLSITGDNIKGHVISESTIKVYSPKALAMLDLS
ncbi:DUF5309 family protein [Aneurinibacillus thermoaerophilus]|uniref:SU10 major capsid protein n=1 Tax=Aneurinibacillus thermoaerophilus TaxID=143495 RepID=UPI002E1D8E14|nr:DUF5309 family protein [Aneurinibacillus thermoaerophilus]